MLPAMPSETRKKIDRLDRRIARLTIEREELVRDLAREQGFTPCGDCSGGYCTMNCSSAPGYIKTYTYL